MYKPLLTIEEYLSIKSEEDLRRLTKPETWVKRTNAERQIELDEAEKELKERKNSKKTK
jgi:hypothetical protein